MSKIILFLIFLLTSQSCLKSKSPKIPFKEEVLGLEKTIDSFGKLVISKYNRPIFFLNENNSSPHIAFSHSLPDSFITKIVIDSSHTIDSSLYYVFDFYSPPISVYRKNKNLAFRLDFEHVYTDSGYFLSSLILNPSWVWEGEVIDYLRNLNN